MTVPYVHDRDETVLLVEAATDFRVLSNHGWTVRVYSITLADYPDTRWATRSVQIEGLHIRKDGHPGAHRRGGLWKDGEPLPAELAAVVDRQRPGWWEGGSR